MTANPTATTVCGVLIRIIRCKSIYTPYKRHIKMREIGYKVRVLARVRHKNDSYNPYNPYKGYLKAL